MPTPVALPSLRSENAGNDPNISLVPSGTSMYMYSGVSVCVPHGVNRALGVSLTSEESTFMEFYFCC